MTPPKKILLATDLSPRSDRAQDRAVSLAKQFDSELIALHVIESFNENHGIRRIPFLPLPSHNKLAIKRARQLLHTDIGSVNPKASIRIEEGEPFEKIMRVATETNCDLIITGVARYEILGRFTPGKTAGRLLRKSGISLLVVTERCRGPYRKIVTPTDLSVMSKHAIETAAAFFPDQTLSVLYPFTTPKSSSVDNVAEYREQMRQVAQRDLADFLGTADLTVDQRARVSMVIEYGDKAKLLSNFVQLSGSELVVVGFRLQGLLSYAFLGDHAKRIISSLPCDTLVVRGVD